MSISSCREQEEMGVRTTTFPENRDKKEILRKIEQKL